jgi:hypothetical protein
MKQPDIFREIARIEGEIARLAGELRALRERFDAGAVSAAPPRRNTMAFSAPPPPMDHASAVPAIPPPPRSRARGRSVMPPAPAAPTAAVQDIQALAVDSIPPPPPSRVHARSSIRPIAMREAEIAESAPQTESSRERVEAGRYGFVSEAKTRTATRSR